MQIFRKRFTTPFNQYAEREGQKFTVLKTINTPDDNHDLEVLPMYQIKFEDGFVTDAWPEEVLLARPLDKVNRSKREREQT